MSNLIFNIEKLVNEFPIVKSVKLFVPKTYTLCSLAGASALSAYLNQVCEIPTTLVVSDEKRVNQISMCLPLTESPSEIKKNANDFVAVIIDCQKLDECDNDSYNKTFGSVLQVRGGVSMNDFGIEGYNDADALCGAEIIFNAIQKHSQTYYTYCPEAYDYLYLAMLDATSVFKLHMKTNTFEAIQEIIMCGAEVKFKPECFRQKDSKEIEILENIYTNCVIEDHVGYIVFRDKRWSKYSAAEFQNVLEYIRLVKLVDVWIVFVDNGKEEYTTFVQGNATGKFDIVKSFKNRGAVGSRKKAKWKTPVKEAKDVLEEAKKMVSEGKLKEKPRKKYTHKLKKNDIEEEIDEDENE